MSFFDILLGSAATIKMLTDPVEVVKVVLFSYCSDSYKEQLLLQSLPITGIWFPTLGVANSNSLGVCFPVFFVFMRRTRCREILQGVTGGHAVNDLPTLKSFYESL